MLERRSQRQAHVTTVAVRDDAGHADASVSHGSSLGSSTLQAASTTATTLVHPATSLARMLSR
jgi:hypothetical protein